MSWFQAFALFKCNLYRYSPGAHEGGALVRVVVAFVTASTFTRSAGGTLRHGRQPGRGRHEGDEGDKGESSLRFLSSFPHQTRCPHSLGMDRSTSSNPFIPLIHPTPPLSLHPPLPPPSAVLNTRQILAATPNPTTSPRPPSSRV
jgi:hypothetical protein